jgi:hypothetical protein
MNKQTEYAEGNDDQKRASLATLGAAPLLTDQEPEFYSFGFVVHASIP